MPLPDIEWSMLTVRSCFEMFDEWLGDKTLNTIIPLKAKKQDLFLFYLFDSRFDDEFEGGTKWIDASTGRIDFALPNLSSMPRRYDSKVSTNELWNWAFTCECLEAWINNAYSSIITCSRSRFLNIVIDLRSDSVHSFQHSSVKNAWNKHLFFVIQMNSPDNFEFLHRRRPGRRLEHCRQDWPKIGQSLLRPIERFPPNFHSFLGPKKEIKINQQKNSSPPS